MNRNFLKYLPVDVNEGNFYKDIYPYDKLPIIEFNNEEAKLDLDHEMWVTDTTLRDGQQSMNAFSPKQSLSIYEFLNKIDNNEGLIRQAEFFVYSNNDRDAIKRCLDKGYEFPEVTTWIRANKEDFKIVKDVGVKETGLLMSCSDYHIFKKLGKNRKEVMQMYLEVANEAIENGIKPRCHLEDITRADFFGFVLPLVRNLDELCKEKGVKVKIRACDTLGVGLPYSNTTLPRSVPKTISNLKALANLESSMVEWHGHNDFHKAVANSSAAWMYGASGVNTTLLGIGERCGNTPLEAMLLEYYSLTGKENNLRLELLNEVADFFEKEFEYTIHEKYPIMGRDFNTTKAGIHADGLLKDPEIYNSFDTKKILSRPIVIMINQASGLSGIAGWINNYYQLKEKERFDKKDERILKIKAWVDLEFEKGRKSAISNEELRKVTEKEIPSLKILRLNKEQAGTAL